MKLRTLLPALLLTFVSCHRFTDLAGQPTHHELLRRSGFAWQTGTTEHFRVYTERGTAADQMPDLLGLQLEQSYLRAHRLLQLPDDDQVIHVFAVSGRNRMEKLVGRRIDGLALHRSRVIVMVVGVGDGRAAEPTHEVMHIIAMNALGVGPVWLNEGLGVYAGGRWRGLDLHQAAREQLRNNKLVELEKLTREFRSVDPNIAFPQAGSLARFIHESYGAAAVRALWSEDTGEFEKQTGASLDSIDRRWRAFLQQ